MNIFVLDTCPEIAAQSLCDQHVVKMLLESAQMLCSAFPEDTAPYKRSHYNHPCSVWTRSSEANWNWHVSHALSIGAEYTKRYGKVHKSEQVVRWCAAHSDLLSFPNKDIQQFVQAMPDQYKSSDPVRAYRDYYIGEKLPFARYRHTVRPDWLSI